MNTKRIISRILLFILVAGIGLLANWTANANRQVDQLETLQAEDIAPGRFLTIDGRRVHVRIVGGLNDDPTGAPLLLLHGFGPAGSEEWLEFPDIHLAPHRTLIIPDFLGMGYSERITEPGPYFTISGQAGLIAAVLDKLDIKQVDLVGHSYGGAVSAQLALDHPEIFRRIVLLDAQIYENRIGAFFQSLGALPFGIGRAITWNSLGGGAPQEFYFCENGGPCPIQQIVLIEDTVDTLLAINDTQQISRLPQDLGLIDLPVLVAWGTEDVIVAPEEGSRLAEEMGSDFILIDGGSHSPFIEQPAATAEALLSFFLER